MNAWRRSATLRLTVIVALGILLVSLAVMVAQYRTTRALLVERQQQLLQSDLDALAALYAQRRIIALREAIEFSQGAAAQGRLSLLTDRDGTRLAGSLQTWPEALRAPAGKGFEAGATEPEEINVEGQPYLVLARVLPGGFALLLGRESTSTEATLAQLRRQIWLVGIALIIGALAAGAVVARRVLSEVGALNQLADKVAAGDLAARLPMPLSDDEFGTLAQHVHHMLDRIQALNRATHRLSDTIAHELRTPLNRLRQHLTRLELAPEAEESLSAEIREIVTIFDSLLDISRAEAREGEGSGLVPVSLSEIAGEVFDLYEPLAEDKGLTARHSIAPDLTVLGERNLIARLIANLIDNAIKYTEVGGDISLELSAEGTNARLIVADSGPGLPEDIKGEAFEHFTRGERDRQIKGHGLGLALVKAIATRHGARLTLPASTKGLVIRIDWPLAALGADGTKGPAPR